MSGFFTFILIVQTLVAVSLISLILAQRSEGGGLAGGGSPAGMMSARGASDFQPHDLCRGPGNLTMAMGITLEQNLVDLCGETLFLEDRGVIAGPIVWGPRIGISVGTDRPWRVYVKDHPAVSPMSRPR